MHKRGFTLIELLVSLAIFAVITGFSVANYRAGRQGDELRRGSQVVAGLFRHAQTMAVAGEGVYMCLGGSGGSACLDDGDCESGRCLQGSCAAVSATTCRSSADCGSGTVCDRGYPTGYGVHLDTAAGQGSVAVLFADIDGNRRFDAGEEISRESVAGGRFVNVTGTSPAASGVLDTVWEPPKPSTWFNASDATAIATVTLTHSVTGDTRAVTVNRITGQVSAD